MDSIPFAQPQTSAPRSAQRFGHTATNSMAALELALHWRSTWAQHTDRLVAEKLNLWRDLLPAALEPEIVGQPVGHTASCSFVPGELVEPYREGDCLELPHAAFNTARRRIARSAPHAGRFYPLGCIAGVRGIFPEDVRPFRVGATEPRLTVDLNHPLAGLPTVLEARVLDAWSAGDEHGGRCTDIAELVTIDGPGMQARWRARPTDFFSDQPFQRAVPEADAAFYAKPRLVDHLDRTALAQVEKLYGRLLTPGSRVLDLMASWKSHLPEHLEPAEVVGLGMNQGELDANPRLARSLVQDLNTNAKLPFEDASFDAVVCTVSVEYLTRPVEVFAEIRRVLKPGGRCVITFSNRWFPPKVVRVWQGCHEFERLGLVLEYFLLAGGFIDLETFSIRGLPRPSDDMYADRLAHADPIFAVWGSKP